MKNVGMGEAYVGRAKECLREAREAMRRGDYPGVVRRSQECVEFALKGAMRLYGVEHPRKHDIKDVLLRISERFPSWFASELDQLGEISAALAKDRGPSMYGDEEKGIPPSELFGRKEAEGALRGAEFVYDRCEKLFKEFMKKVKR